MLEFTVRNRGDVFFHLISQTIKCWFPHPVLVHVDI